MIGFSSTTTFCAASVDSPVYMGGVLNEDVVGSDMPIDVRGDLSDMGIRIPDTIDELLESMKAAIDESSPHQPPGP